MKTEATDTQFYQSVWLTLSDGKRIGFIGVAELFPGDKRTIKNIEFTPPKPMPEGCGFAQIDDLK